MPRVQPPDLQANDGRIACNVTLRVKKEPFSEDRIGPTCLGVGLYMLHIYIAVAWSFVTTAVPVMNGHSRDQAKVLVRRRDGWVVSNVIHLERLHSSQPAIFVLI